MLIYIQVLVFLIDERLRANQDGIGIGRRRFRFNRNTRYQHLEGAK